MVRSNSVFYTIRKLKIGVADYNNLITYKYSQKPVGCNSIYIFFKRIET